MQPAPRWQELRWDDPRYWQGISVGLCTACGEEHVVREGVCWYCEPSESKEARS